MKKIIAFAFVLSCSYLAVQSLHSRPSGAPAGVAGGPAEGGQTCSQIGCHNGTPTTVTNILTTTIPASGYSPGRVYSITVSFTGSGQKGFQVSPQLANGHAAGLLMSGTGSQIMGSNYITHTSTKTASPASWTFNWQAPSRGTGNFNFYGAFAITKNITRKQILNVLENTSLPLVVTKSAANITNNGAQVSGDIDANNGTYTASVQFKPLGGKWTLQNASPADVTGDANQTIQINLSNLNGGTHYTYRFCAWNAGDTTWGDTLSFNTTGIPSGIAQQQIQPRLMIWPQPVNGLVSFELPDQVSGAYDLNIYSLKGEVLFHEQSIANTNQITIATQALTGICLYELRMKDIIWQGKLLAE